ncbi:hypothetical protein QBC37DRAFT_483583 [Rhypophila decipiens]|uniref:Uncharacterized protein n=1 Tax=Rhypophila decipiens TaxID=261697 RepID=A0AAN6YB18_9PEZI|nr:hypothetical protein QBC37DRAFT_483583 [Rhypophila decipiens]
MIVSIAAKILGAQCNEPAVSCHYLPPFGLCRVFRGVLLMMLQRPVAVWFVEKVEVHGCCGLPPKQIHKPGPAPARTTWEMNKHCYEFMSPAASAIGRSFSNKGAATAEPTVISNGRGTKNHANKQAMLRRVYLENTSSAGGNGIPMDWALGVHAQWHMQHLRGYRVCLRLKLACCPSAMDWMGTVPLHMDGTCKLRVDDVNASRRIFVGGGSPILLQLHFDAHEVQWRLAARRRLLRGWVLWLEIASKNYNLKLASNPPY